MVPDAQVTRYRALIQTARCFARAMDRRTLIDEILDRSQAVMRAEACTLFLPDHRTRELILHSTDPKLAALPEPLRIPAGKGIAGAVFETRQPMNIQNAQNDTRHFSAVGRQVGLTARAMLTIPLLEGDECLGVLQAINPRDRDFFDEIDAEIFEGFGGLIANALVRLEAERREIEIACSNQQMEVAREIQESFLPAAVQKFPFCQVHLRNFPAQAVGGDFCCVHPIGGSRLLLGLGDVTGKGIPAALTMARATAMIRAGAGQSSADLGDWVTNLNNQLAEDLGSGRFIGLTFMLADAGAATLQICAAGQYPPLHFDGQRWQPFDVPNQLPLGIMPGHRYKASSVPLRPGEFWLLCSDGITEARNRAGEDFTLGRLQSSLPVGESSSKTVAATIEAWRKFAGAAPQHDDASLLLLDWRGAAPPAEMEMLCCAENLKCGRDFIERWAAYAGFDDTTVGQIVTACDEAATNIFRHGYRQHPGPIAYHAEIGDSNLTFKIQDRAQPIDPMQIRGRDLADVKPGGLGTVIINHVFDTVRYEPAAHGTLLVLAKKLP